MTPGKCCLTTDRLVDGVLPGVRLPGRAVRETLGTWIGCQGSLCTDKHAVFGLGSELRKRPYSGEPDPATEVDCAIIADVDRNMRAPGIGSAIEEQEVERLIMIGHDPPVCSLSSHRLLDRRLGTCRPK